MDLVWMRNSYLYVMLLSVASFTIYWRHNSWLVAPSALPATLRAIAAGLKPTPRVRRQRAVIELLRECQHPP